jgi:hypothetical protein
MFETGNVIAIKETKNLLYHRNRNRNRNRNKEFSGFEVLTKQTKETTNKFHGF